MVRILMKAETLDWRNVREPVYNRDKYFNAYDARIHVLTKCDMSDIEIIRDILDEVSGREPMGWMTRKMIDYRIKKAYTIFLEEKSGKE